MGERVSTLKYPVLPSLPFPALGNQRVWVGPGVVVAGDVTIGDDASVGADSLLLRDVPQRGVVLGVPAGLVWRSIMPFTRIRYQGMDNDDERKASLAADSEETREG